MVFTIRPYAERDAAACGECLYEGFFTAPIDHCDKLLLRDYAQVLIEKCNFTFVAEAEDGQVVGVRLREIRQSLRPNFGKPIWVQKALWLVVQDVSQILFEAL